MSKRTVDFKETIGKSKEYLESIGLNFETKTKNIDNVVWVSEIFFKNNNFNGMIMKGKGTSEEECLASLYGEVIERISLFNNKVDGRDKILNIEDSNLYDIDREFVVKQLKDTKYCSAGNSFDEAIIHSLYEIFEISFTSQNDIYPSEKFIINTKNYFPWPEHVHDNIIAFASRDLRFPVYGVRTLRNVEGDIPKYGIFEEDGVLNFKDDVSNKRLPTSGYRIGRSVEETVPYALSEAFQILPIDTEESFLENSKKKDQKIVPVYNDVESFSMENMKDEIASTVNSMKPYYSFLGVLDLTPENSPLKVVKLITDFDPYMSIDAELEFRRYFE